MHTQSISFGWTDAEPWNVFDTVDEILPTLKTALVDKAKGSWFTGKLNPQGFRLGDYPMLANFIQQLTQPQEDGTVIEVLLYDPTGWAFGNKVMDDTIQRNQRTVAAIELNFF